MVTAPVQKEHASWMPAYAFSGHTEYLAERNPRAAMPVMLLLNDQMRVALVTTHLGLGRCAERHHQRAAAFHPYAS